MTDTQKTAVENGTAVIGGKFSVTYDGGENGTGYSFSATNNTFSFTLPELTVDPTAYVYYSTAKVNGLRIYGKTPAGTNHFRIKGGAGAVYDDSGIINAPVELGSKAYQQLNTYNHSKYFDNNAYGVPVADGSAPAQLKEYVPSGDLISSGVATFSTEKDDNLADYIKEIKIKYYKIASKGVNPRYWLEYTFYSEGELSTEAKSALESGDVALKGTVTFNYSATSAVSGLDVGFKDGGFTVPFTEGDTLTIKKLDIPVVENYRIKDVYTDKAGAYEFRSVSKTPGKVNGKITASDLGGEFYQLVFTSKNSDLEALTVADNGAIPEELAGYVPAGDLVDSNQAVFTDGNAGDYIKSVDIEFRKDANDPGKARYWLHYTLKSAEEISDKAMEALGLGGLPLTGKMTVTYGGVTGFVNEKIEVNFSGNSSKLKVNSPVDPLRIHGFYDGDATPTLREYDAAAGYTKNKETAKVAAYDSGAEYYLLMGACARNSESKANNSVYNDKTLQDVRTYAPEGNLIGTDYLEWDEKENLDDYIEEVSFAFLNSAAGSGEGIGKNPRWYLKIKLRKLTANDVAEGPIVLNGEMEIKYSPDANLTDGKDHSFYDDIGLNIGTNVKITISDDITADNVNLKIKGISDKGWRKDSQTANQLSSYEIIKPGEKVYLLLNTGKNSDYDAFKEEKSFVAYAPFKDENGNEINLLTDTLPGLTFSWDGDDGSKENIESIKIRALKNSSGKYRWYLEIVAKDNAAETEIKGTIKVEYDNTTDETGIDTGFAEPLVLDFSKYKLEISNETTYRLKYFYYTGSGNNKEHDGFRKIGQVETRVSAEEIYNNVAPGDTIYHMVFAENQSDLAANFDSVASGAVPAELQKYLPDIVLPGSMEQYVESAEFKLYDRHDGTKDNARYWLEIKFKDAETLESEGLLDDVEAAGDSGITFTGSITAKDPIVYAAGDKLELPLSGKTALRLSYISDEKRIAAIDTTYTYCMYDGLLATWTPEGEALESGSKGVSEVSWGDSIYFALKSYNPDIPVTDGGYALPVDSIDIDDTLEPYVRSVSIVRAALRSNPDLERYFLEIRFKGMDELGGFIPGALTDANGNISITKTGEKGYVGETISVNVDMGLRNDDLPYNEVVERTEENQKVAKFYEIGYGTNKRIQALVEDEDGRLIERYKNAIGQTSTSYTYADYGDTVYFMLEDAAGNRVIDGDYVSGIKITPEWLSKGSLVDNIEFVMKPYNGGRANQDTDYCYFLAVTFAEREYTSRENVTGEITLSGSGKHGISDYHLEWKKDDVTGKLVAVEVPNEDNKIMLTFDVWVGPMDSTMNETNSYRHYFADRKITDIDTRYNFVDPPYNPNNSATSHDDVGTDEEDTIYLWGTQGDCYFTVDTRKQGRITLSNNTDYDEYFGNIYGNDAEIQFINGNGATFKKNGIMTISVPEDSYYIYQIKNGMMQEIPELTFDKQECAYQFRTRHLGRYVISSEKLDLNKQYYSVDGFYEPEVSETVEE
ncbi:MAG: hypothetical protein IJF25_04795 [Oscillospiraceae bacterium]|nr:hypothetical protein [Oscillospiraceae bacterium]